MKNWYIYLRNLGYGRFQSLCWAYYNNKYWKPEGKWPNEMKMRK